MEKNWILKSQGEGKDVERLSAELDIAKPLATLLVQRGFNTFDKAETFFRPQLSDLHDPFLMKDMEDAVSRIRTAIENKERIMVYGDYDVDGTTSVALVYIFLETIYDSIDFYIPNRYNEGYGVSQEGIDYARETGVTLIIALDCGIKAIEKVKYAKHHGIDFIICDHHNPGNEIPPAVAVLDPKRIDCTYPDKELSGCGVGFKLIQGFASRNGIPFEDLIHYLDLVAVSIASDIVPVTGENRILAHYGLKQLNKDPRTGLKAIIELAGIVGKEISIDDVVFKIGPRINAAGRMESGKSAVKLLIAKDREQAKEMGDKIDTYNSNRRNIDTSIT
ncbi:MAG: DHH family phosphoesterase, partial [Bacteroidales bacterium]|nr:DHH family phosphoesterase [Bacteroidales bacterium]